MFVFYNYTGISKMSIKLLMIVLSVIADGISAGAVPG